MNPNSCSPNVQFEIGPVVFYLDKTANLSEPFKTMAEAYSSSSFYVVVFQVNVAW
jgi:hypothetical protein